MTYKEMLLDRRWDRRKSEIKIRDNYTCQFCENELLKNPYFPNKNNVQVHHLEYLNGRMPWEYEDEYLTTLCEICHSMCYRNRIITDFILEKLEYMSYPRKLFAIKTADELVDEVEKVSQPIDFFEHGRTHESQLNWYEINLLRNNNEDLKSERIAAIIEVITRFRESFFLKLKIDGEEYSLSEALTIMGMDKWIDETATHIEQLKRKKEIEVKATFLLKTWSKLQKRFYESN